MFHESDIFDQLSHPLQSEVAMVKCKPVLSTLKARPVSRERET